MYLFKIKRSKYHTNVDDYYIINLFKILLMLDESL